MSFTASVACLLTIGSVCVHDLKSLEITDSGLFQNADIHGSSYEAVIELRSDYIPAPDWSRMNSVCSGDLCVFYFKHCESSGQMVCQYWFSQPGDAKNTRVMIKAKDQDELDAAENDFGAIAKSDAVQAVFSFKRFTALSREASPPLCSHRVPQSSCLPSH